MTSTAQPGASLQATSTAPSTSMRPLPRTPTATPAGPAISVVIPTYRRVELLRRCVEAVLAQVFDPAAFEVIVVDDGHDDAIRALVHSLVPRPPAGRALDAGPQLRYLRPPAGRGPAVARNAGWQVARGALIAFTDDDTVPDPGWLAAGAAAMARHADWSALCGRVVVPRAGPGRPTDHELMTQGLETAQFVTANAFVRRDALVRVDGFDERFTRAWREDSDLQFRLLTLGPVGRCEEARVLHPVRAEAWGLSLRQQRNSFFEALLYKKHPELYRERIRPLRPWNYYAIVAATFAAPLLAATGGRRSALAAVGVATGLVLQFAWRRLRRSARDINHVTEMLVTSAVIPFLSVFWRLRGALAFRVPFL